MKKIILMLMISALLVCSMAIITEAKIIDTVDNTIEAKEVNVEMDDIIIIHGTFVNKYYTITIPYNGRLKIYGEASGSQTTTTNISYEINVRPYNADYYSVGSVTNSYIHDSKTSTKPARKYNVWGLSPGKYRVVITKDFGQYLNDAWDLKFTFSFECSHIETEEVTVREATCSKEGYVEERCIDCKEVVDSYDLDKLDHTPDAEWTIIKETSCKEAGERVKNCTVCKEEAESEEIKKLPHEWGDWTITKETSCAKDGEKARTCKACGDVDKETIDSLEHTWSKWEVLSEASCEQEGLRTHTCSVCNKEEREAIEKEDHRFESWKTTKDASESSTGKKERTCKDCDYTEEETIPKLACGDEYEWVTSTKATCTSNGTKKKVCDYCGKTLSTQTIYAEGHEWGNWEVTRTPTTTRNGLQERECEICGETEEKTVTLTHGDYGEWKVTKEATCEETGKKEFICYCCNKVTDTETIKKTGHSYGDWVVEKTATPEKDGLQTAKCKNCDEKKTEVIEYDFEKLKKENRKQHSFSDVKPNSWYYDVVGSCYHYGLMVGNSETTFNPAGNITRAEVITSAVRIYCLNNPDMAKPETETSPWYKGYVDYAIEKGIIKPDDFTDYTVPATRAEMAYIFANAEGSENLEKINNVTSIPDVKDGDKYAKEIFSLYNAGVLTGSDEEGTFNPNQNIVRSESAAIIARISKISDRVKK